MKLLGSRSPITLLHRADFPTVDVVEMQLPAQHEKGAKGQTEAERTRQVTVTYGIHTVRVSAVDPDPNSFSLLDPDQASICGSIQERKI